jgi:hypothetical protein
MRVSFHRLLPKEIVKDEGIPLKKGTCLRDKANKTKTCKQWLVLQLLMTIFNIYMSNNNM